MDASAQERSDAPVLIAPFAAWMVLMLLLPSESWSYPVRTVVTLFVLAWSARKIIRNEELGIRNGGTGNLLEMLVHPSFIIHHSSFVIRSLAWGLAGGLLVLFLWVWPEKAFGWYREYCMYGYTANAPVDSSGWALKAIRLFGSAFVISVAEELFFRKWLLRYAGFVWMTALFAVQHNRWLAAAITGAIYGWLAMRKGLVSAIVAHVVTNLLLGIYVLWTGDWVFW